MVSYSSYSHWLTLKKERKENWNKVDPDVYSASLWENVCRPRDFTHLKGSRGRLRFMMESLPLQQEGQAKGKIAVMTSVSPKIPTMAFRPSWGQEGRERRGVASRGPLIHLSPHGTWRQLQYTTFLQVHKMLLSLIKSTSTKSAWFGGIFSYALTEQRDTINVMTIISVQFSRLKKKKDLRKSIHAKALWGEDSIIPEWKARENKRGEAGKEIKQIQGDTLGSYQAITASQETAGCWLIRTRLCRTHHGPEQSPHLLPPLGQGSPVGLKSPALLGRIQ